MILNSNRIQYNLRERLIISFHSIIFIESRILETRTRMHELR